MRWPSASNFATIGPCTERLSKLCLAMLVLKQEVMDISMTDKATPRLLSRWSQSHEQRNQLFSKCNRASNWWLGSKVMVKNQMHSRECMTSSIEPFLLQSNIWCWLRDRCLYASQDRHGMFLTVAQYNGDSTTPGTWKIRIIKAKSGLLWLCINLVPGIHWMQHTWATWDLLCWQYHSVQTMELERANPDQIKNLFLSLEVVIGSLWKAYG